MSRTGALNDAEIQSEMNKMVRRLSLQLYASKEANPQVAFISQEAREKAREIQVKADEEFAIEKVSISASYTLVAGRVGRDCGSTWLRCERKLLIPIGQDRQARESRYRRSI